MKNNLQSLNLENLKNIVVGSTFFGGGGGGSREEGDALVELMKEEGGSGLEIPLVQVSQMETKKDGREVVSTMVAALGSPTATKGKTFVDEAQNAVEGMIREAKNSKKELVYIYSGEQGGGNTMLPIYVAYKKGMPLLDVDGNGRAVPAMDTGLQPIHGVPTSPVVLASEAGDTIVGTTKDPLDCKACEQIARYLCQAYDQGIGFAAWMMNKEQHEAASAVGQLSESDAVGEIFRNQKSEEVLDALANYFERENRGFCVLCKKGVIEKIEMDASGGFDRGFTWITGDDGTTWKVLFQNENLVAYQGEDLAAATVPGIITLIDLADKETQKAMPVSNTETYPGQCVALVYVEPPAGWSSIPQGYTCWNEILISAGYCEVGKQVIPKGADA